MRRSAVCFFAGATFLAVACASSSQPSGAPPATRPEPSESRKSGAGDPASRGFVTLYKARDSDFIGTVREIVRDSARWGAVWDSSSNRRDPAAPLPEIDFERSMVVLAAGPRGGTGDAVLINQVTDSGTTLQVRVTAYQKCSPLQMVTRPVHLVRVRRSQRKAVFENRWVRGSNCIPIDPMRAP
jgi:hypothetical protein